MTWCQSNSLAVVPWLPVVYCTLFVTLIYMYLDLVPPVSSGKLSDVCFFTIKCVLFTSEHTRKAY